MAPAIRRSREKVGSKETAIERFGNDRNGIRPKGYRGIQGSTNRHIDEVMLIDALILSWNGLLDK